MFIILTYFSVKGKKETRKESTFVYVILLVWPHVAWIYAGVSFIINYL